TGRRGADERRLCGRESHNLRHRPARRRVVHNGAHGLRVELIYGAHVNLNSKDPDADRAILRDVLGFDSVDAGGGWLIFALPPAEAAIHPAETPSTDLYLMCSDLEAEMQSLAQKGISFSPVEQARWGSVTSV